MRGHLDCPAQTTPHPAGCLDLEHRVRSGRPRVAADLRPGQVRIREPYALPSCRTERLRGSFSRSLESSAELFVSALYRLLKCFY